MIAGRRPCSTILAIVCAKHDCAHLLHSPKAWPSTSAPFLITKKGKPYGEFPEDLPLRVCMNLSFYRGRAAYYLTTGFFTSQSRNAVPYHACWSSSRPSGLMPWDHDLVFEQISPFLCRRG